MNSKPKIFFIGTGSGRVSLKRNHSAFILSNNNYNLLVDAGEGITKNLLSAGVDLNSINAIIISHFHPDHINGISLLLNQMKMNKRLFNLKIYVHKNLAKYLVNFIETSNIYLDRLNFECTIIPFNQNKKYKFDEGLGFTAKLNSHLNKPGLTVGIKKLISLSFLFEVNNQKVFYSGDIGHTEDLYLCSDEHPDIFITESTHVSFSEIVKVHNELNPGTLIITHIADDIEKSLINKHKKLNQEIRKKILIAEEKMIVQL